MQDKKIEVILEDLDESNITSILTKWKEVHYIKNQIIELEESLKNKIKVYLKEKQWKKFKDEVSNISVSLDIQKRETIDIKQLKLMLTEYQYANILKITTFEKMIIVTPEMREKLKRLLNKPKNNN